MKCMVLLEYWKDGKFRCLASNKGAILDMCLRVTIPIHLFRTLAYSLGARKGLINTTLK